MIAWILRYVDDARDEALRAAGLAATGEKLASGSTVRQMQKNLVDKLQKQGFMTVQYGSGERAYQVSLDAYAEMVARSTTREAGNLARETQLTENGYDLVKMTKHYPTCEKCAPLQGRVYSISGNDKRFPPLSRAFRPPYHNVHPRCRHSVHAYIESLRTDEEIAEAIERSNKPFTDERSDAEKSLYSDQQAANRQMRQDRYQYERYKARLGDDAPKSFHAFRKTKKAGGENWDRLQEKYRYEGVIDRILDHNKGIRVFRKASEIPPNYAAVTDMLTDSQKNGLYHYSHYVEGKAMNMYLGKAPGATLSTPARQDLDEVVSALDDCSLPYDTVLWRGAESQYLDGFDKLPKNISEWKAHRVSYSGFSSTSILRDTSYSDAKKDVQMVIVKRGNQKGASYINDISYAKRHGLPQEYEILLQKNTEYAIVEAQNFKGKTIVVVEVV